MIAFDDLNCHLRISYSILYRYFSFLKVPFLLNKPGDGHHVEGEIYRVDDTMLECKRCFRLE